MWKFFIADFVIALNVSHAKSIIPHLDSGEDSKRIMHITADEIPKSLHPKNQQ